MDHRPYRSHKVPACTRCRQRKIRCNVDIPGQACLFCRERNATCEVALTLTAQAQADRDDSRPSKRQRNNNNTEFSPAANVTGNVRSSASMSTDAVKGRSSIIVGPALAEDVEIVQRHMPGTGRQFDDVYRSTNSYPNTGNSLVYVSVPKYRRGVRPTEDVGRKQRDIIENILGPFKQEIVRLFFDHIHPFFPVFEDKFVQLLLNNPPQHEHSAVMCHIYASALPLWKKSEILRIHPYPNSDFIWIQACSTMQEEATSPSFWTVPIMTINIIGRPSLGWLSNILNTTRAASLAQKFGLNRNPINWEIPITEIEMRIRLWWAVFINDSWCSLAYGSPPTILKGCYDVSVPDPPRDSSGQRISNTFAQLCSLTQILADILPIVYQLKLPDPYFIQDEVVRARDSLERWNKVSMDVTDMGGTNNLWFCYRSVKLLLARLEVRVAWQLQAQSPEPDTNLMQHHLLNLRDTAIDMIDYVCCITPAQLQDFWLPYTAHVLVIAAMILLRCGLEAEDDEGRRPCATILMNFKTKLEEFRDKHDWELGDFCLEHCGDLITRFKATILPATTDNFDATKVNGIEATDSGINQLIDDSMFLFDGAGGFDSIDDFWQSLLGIT